MVSWQRSHQVVGSSFLLRLSTDLLRTIPVSRKVPVSNFWCDFVSYNRQHGGSSDVHLAFFMGGRIHNGVGCYFGLENRRNGLCLVRQPAAHPAKLRSI